MSLADFRLVVVQPPDSDRTNAMAADVALRAGEVEIEGVADLVEVAERRCARRKAKIYCLYIVGHGTSSAFHIGRNVIDDRTVYKHLSSWNRLSRCLAKDGEVILFNCRAGRNKNLLLIFSAFLGGRAVTAPLWDQPPGNSFIWGDDVECVVSKGCRLNRGAANWDSDKKNFASLSDRQRQRNAASSR
jgi:hypothetical protein